MTQVENRGAPQDISTLASVDIFAPSFFQEEDGSIRPITTETFHTEIKDDEYKKTLSTHTHTITDAAAGEFDFLIPYSAFTGKEDQEFSHETYYLKDNVRHPMTYGIITVEERG